jgi:DNA polymerase delta subunit 1
MVKIFFRPHSWHKFTDDSETAQQGFHIEAYAHNKDSEPVLARVDDFTPYSLLELPELKGHVWTEGDAMLFHDYFRMRMKSNAPLKCSLTRRKRLYYYRGDKTFPLLQVSFQNEDGLRHIGNICKYPLEIPGLPKVQLTPREFDVGQVKKMLTLRKTTYIAWMSAEAEELGPDDERRIGTDNGFKHEYLVSWRSLTPVPEEECSTWSISPLLFSWDIEVQSHNPKVFPNPLNVGDYCAMIGVTVQRLNQPSTRKKYCLVYGPCDNVPDVEVRRFKTERELIFGFCALINETNPDVLLGYNIIGFDYSFVNRRLMNNLDAWPCAGRVAGRRPELRELKWQSSAYGFQTLTYIEPLGRISMDMLPLIQRDYKLDKYTLDFTSEFFLKKNKIGIDMKDMFRYFQIAHGTCFPDILAGLELDDTKVLTDLTDGSKYFPLHTTEAIEEAMAAYRATKGTPAMGEAVLAVYRKYQGTVMAIVAVYCAQDTVLPIELFEKLNTWVNTCELAGIVKVPVMDTFTRGQQVRVFSQFYDEIVENGYYVDTRVNPDLPFCGGYVCRPIPGLHKDVISFDFASLYPSIILAKNLCYTTYVPDHIQGVPDSMTNIIEWDEAGGEEAAGVEEEEGDTVANDVALPGEDDEGEAGAKVTKTKSTHFRFRFLKKEYQEGVYPRFIRRLLEKRKATRKIMEGLVEYSFDWNVLNARQNALKVSSNSCYGFLGVRKGKLPFIEAALCTTAIGRQSIHAVMEEVRAEGGLQVYGDTDSCMCSFPMVSRSNLYTYGKAMAIKLSRNLPPPMKLEFERAYAVFFAFTAKRYACVILREDGTPEPNESKFYKRGIVLSRRDNCILLRELYKDILMCILYDRGIEEANLILVKYINLLMSRSVPRKKFVVIKALNKAYKSESNVMFLYSRVLQSWGKPAEPGDRLEFVFYENDEKLQGRKMMPPEMMAAEPERYKIDRLYYFEKSLMKPVQQLFQIAFNCKKEFMKNTLKKLVAKQALTRQIDEMGRKARTIKIKF